MRLKLIFPAAMLLFLSCSDSGKRKPPDVSAIQVSLPLERFDTAFFGMDTLRLGAELQRLRTKFPAFFPDFMQQVLGVSPDPTDSMTRYVTARFLQGYRPVQEYLQQQFRSTAGLQGELEQAFRYVRHYFPDYPTGRITLFTGPFDAPGIASTSQGLAIGLQQYAGADYPAYQSREVQELFPIYISRRFAAPYIVPNCMKAIIADLFPDSSAGKPLIEQMVEKGKQWYLMDLLLPRTPDSLKTGFTQAQLDWCLENEGQIWTEIVRNGDLNSLNPVTIQNYIGEGPFTQGFSQEDSPGNLGQWIGWRIVGKYMEKHRETGPEALMKLAPRQLLEEAKYKPK